MWTLGDSLHPLVRKLESIIDLSEDERRAIVESPATVRDLRANQDIIREHDRPSQCFVILDGFACRYKAMEGGQRQIVSFHIPGDTPDLLTLHVRVMDHNIATMISSKVAFIAHETVRELIRAHPRIGDALWRDTLIDAGIFRDWVVNIGRRDAYARLAHLMCELFVRLRAVGLTHGYTFRLPITQVQIGDAMGLSTVHVNRTIQALRGSGLITLNSGVATINDWDALQAAGQFDSTYLHLRKIAA